MVRFFYFICLIIFAGCTSTPPKAKESYSDSFHKEQVERLQELDSIAK